GMAVGIRTRANADRAGSIVAGLVVIGIGGWLVEGLSLARLAAFDPAGAIAAHPGGPLLALAALRGVIRGGALADVTIGDSLLGGPAYGVAIAWVLGGALADPGRSSFAAEALGPTLLYVVAGPAGSAIGRVAELSRVDGFSWTANRTWLALLAGAFIALAGAAALGAVGGLDAIRSSAPLLIALVLIVAAARGPEPRRRPGDRRKSLVAWFIVFAVILIIVVLPLHPLTQQAHQPLGPTVPTDNDPASRQGGAFLLIAGSAVTAVVVLYMLRRRWASARLARTELGDDRFVDVGFSGFANLGRWRPARRARVGPPTDAAAAYRAALAALATDPATRRSPGETPIAHARRLRTDGAGGLALDLLAADYQLIRFGGRDLTVAEERRAMSRWQIIRAGAENRALRVTLARIVTDERAGEGGGADREGTRDTVAGSRDGRT
ncbi:MAG TPA: DUF4129 domain-containing protein, partial [Candidatus Acidoferrum sp.]|nr:DUF4129 domain-containing protein [Candidatus Acidoferrum sp.]